jgi:hypothetical protein
MAVSRFFQIIFYVKMDNMPVDQHANYRISPTFFILGVNVVMYENMPYG